MLNKARLRKDITSERKERFTIDVKRYNFTSSLITKFALELIEKQGARNIMLYLPMRGEADVTGIINDSLNFYVPVTHGAEIRPALYKRDTFLVAGEFGVQVPSNPEYADKRVIDLILVPGVAFDRSKNRLGYGKGCYDRFLAGMDCVKAGVGFDFQLVDELAAEPHDIKMDYIITESGYF